MTKIKRYGGIDWGMKMANHDPATGIAFGVIPGNGEICEAWSNAAESVYDYACPKCGGDIEKATEEALVALDERLGDEYNLPGDVDYICPTCDWGFSAEECSGENPAMWVYKTDDYFAHQSHDDVDVYVEKSPFYTWAQFCSPCAPGAGYLLNPTEPGVGTQAYCFGHDWFEDEKAPYRVWSVETGREVVAKEIQETCVNCNGTGRDSLQRIAEARVGPRETWLAENEPKMGWYDDRVASIVYRGAVERKVFDLREDAELMQSLRERNKFDEYPGDEFECFRCAGTGQTSSMTTEELDRSSR